MNKTNTESKNEFSRRIFNCDLETLQSWVDKYNTNLYKIKVDDETRELLRMLFMAKDFLNIKNPRILEELHSQIDNSPLKKSHIDLFAIEDILQNIYTTSIEEEIRDNKLNDLGTISFEGTEIQVMEFGNEFSICTGDQSQLDSEDTIKLSLGTNENLGIQDNRKPIYGYLNFDGNLITSMSANNHETGSAVFDDINGMVNSTRNGSNDVEVSWNFPDYILALDEITDEDKRAAKENGLPIYFLDREKIAIAEAKKMDELEARFFKEFNPNCLKRMIKSYFNNRNSLREREDLKEKYFDPLEMQMRLAVLIDELERYINSKASRRVKLSLKYIYDALEEEERLSKDNSKDENEMNINFLKKKINTILQNHQNQLIDETVSQAVEDLENRDDLEEIEKAYFMYLRLGSVLKHDTTYTLERNREESKIIYQYEVDKDGYGICKSIAEEYKKALARIGIDSEITEVVPGGNSTHKDLVIKTKDGKKYFTNLIGDLSNIQTGKRIRNFAIGRERIEQTSPPLGKSYALRLESEIGDFTALSEEDLEQMDNKFHHTYKGIYTNDMFKMIRKEVKDKKFLAELFGTNDEGELLIKTFEFLMDKVGIVNAYNSENMGFYEVTRYYDRLANYAFSDEEKRHFRAFSDMFTIDETGEKKPGCVVILNVDVRNAQTGVMENQNIFYEYSSEEKKFNRTKKEDIIAKNYISASRKRNGEPFNEVIKSLELESSKKVAIQENESNGTVVVEPTDIDFTDK